MKRNSIIKGILCILALTLINMPVNAQKLDIKVDGQKIYDIVMKMSKDDALGRKPNTPEFDRVQEWVVAQYKEWGLEPGGDDGTFYQSVPIQRSYAVTYGTPRMIVKGREFFVRYGDFTIDPRSTTGKTVIGDIVFAGYGISAPDKGLDEYAGLDVKDKFVLVFKGNPNDSPPPRGRMMGMDRTQTQEEKPDQKWTRESADNAKIETAFEKGAAGIIFYNPSTEQTTRFRRGRSTLEASDFNRDFMILSEINERLFNWIFWTDPQVSSNGFRSWLSNLRGDIYKKKVRSFDPGAKAEITGFDRILFRGEEFGDGDGRNIIAKITGTDPVLKDEYVIMGAHFDHLGVTNGMIYNGADDNASGSAVVVELARLFKEHSIKTKRTVVFCLWTAEEMGLIGSRYFVENPSGGVTMANTATYFNMDMVGLGDQIGAPGALNFPEIWEVIKRDQDPEILEAVQASTGGPGGSDHSGFIALGIEALALMTRGGGGHPNYHDTGDDPELIEPKILGMTGQFVLQGTVNLANETVQDLTLDNRQELYDAMNFNPTVINPEIKAAGAWRWLMQETESALDKAIYKKIKELKNPRQEEADPMMRYYRRFMRSGRSNYDTGIKGPAAFGYDISKMYLAKEALGFGRVDFYGDDGIWFSKGISKQGMAGFTAMQDSNIAVHLINPDKKTLSAVLNTATKSVLISGFPELTKNLIKLIKEKDALYAVEVDPENIAASVKALNDVKSRFGDAENIVIDVKSKEGLDEARKNLYLKLIESGWTKEDINKIAGSGGGRRMRMGGGGQSNFEKLAGPRQEAPQRGMMN